MSRKITTRLTLWYVAFFGSAVILIGVSRHILFAVGERQNLDDEGRTYALLLLADSDVWNAPLPQLISSLDSLNRHSELRYRSLRFFLHDDRRVLYDNAERDVIPPLLDSLRARMDEPDGFSTIEYAGQNYRTYTAATTGRDGARLYVTIVIPQEDLDATLTRLRIFLVVGIVLLLAIAGIGGYLLARRSLSMVEQLRRTAAEIGGTNLARRVPVGTSQDELTALARTFNDMIERLERHTLAHRQFVTHTSHDLRTPLTTIRTELQLAQDEAATPEIRDALGRCLKQIDRMDRLTADLMFLARVDADGLQPNPKTTELDELLLDCAEDIRTAAARKDIALEVQLPDDLPVECTCDDYLLRRAVGNLLDNAVRYSPPESMILLRLEKSGSEARITVADNGPGMDAEESRRAVERLYRGPASLGTTGSGLGLAIAGEIVAAHRGRLEIDSIPGKGTSISILLPLAGHP